MKKLILILLLLPVINVFAQSEDNQESDSAYYLNLFKNKAMPGYYFYIPIKNNDTVYQLIITYQSLKYMMGTYGSMKKDKEFVEIVLKALLNHDTIELKQSYPNSFDQFMIPEKHRNITDSIACFGQEYFLDYFFNTSEYNGINQYRGEFKQQIFMYNSNTEIVQLRNAVIYYLIKWRLYVFHKGYSGELVFNKEEYFERFYKKIE